MNHLGVEIGRSTLGKLRCIIHMALYDCTPGRVIIEAIRVPHPLFPFTIFSFKLQVCTFVVG